MTAAASVITCVCGEPLRAGANYCTLCGHEVRQQCPVCYAERRLIAIRDPKASPWCSQRGELLCACTRCGRWFGADAVQCPDPTCRGAVAPNWPASIGRSANGAGSGAPWIWPAAWDRDNPNRTAPAQDDWSSDTIVHAAMAAHGRVYVWTGTGLVAPSGVACGPLAELEAGQPGVSWRCWLGHDGIPNIEIASGGRLAMVGGGVVAACRNEFMLTGLDPSRKDDAIPLEIGVPIAQASGDGWWVAWSRKGGIPALWSAAVSASWRNLATRQIAQAPPESAPRENTPQTCSGGIANWIAADSSIWQLDCRSQEVKQVVPPVVGVQRIWRDATGLHHSRSAGDGLRVALGPGVETGSSREVAAGAGPLRDVFASPTLVAVVGKTVIALEQGTGNAIGEGKYSGRWIAGILTANAPGDSRHPTLDTQFSREPRLLMLTEEGGDGNLAALRTSSGVADVLWRGIGQRPIGLITAGESLYIVHERGVTRLRETVLP